MISKFLKNYVDTRTIILCIGTDKWIGDSLGPFVGYFLKKNLYPGPVYGTLENPVHAINLYDTLKEIKKRHPYSNLVAVDACLGEPINVGKIVLNNRPIYPGKGVGKMMPAVGDISIVGIVDEYNSYNLHNIRLDLIVNMAETICNGILQSIDANNYLSYL
ncbi:spore protease YyaC [Calorimonas adulescens]|uniref:Spore protease YyaC n=2 Tax=Calorimonas adulescens TaxID=2606906 RepID=A0A5D8QFF1_9THEO|nr:spore protease YyaC [Calorimonas adulescens]